jgi:YggT family protein
MSFVQQFLNLLFLALEITILIRILMTWIPNLNPDNPIVQIIRSITDPILEPARRLIPPIGGLDFSPIVVLLLLSVLQSLVTRLF